MKKISLYCFDLDNEKQKAIGKVMRNHADLVPAGFAKRTQIKPASHLTVFLMFMEKDLQRLLKDIKILHLDFPQIPLIVIGDKHYRGYEVSEVIRAGAASFLEDEQLYILPDIVRKLLLEDPLLDLTPDQMLGHYEFLLNVSSNQLSMIDRRFVYLAINDAFCEAHNLIREEVIGKSPEDIWGSETFKTVILPNLEKCFSKQPVHYRAWFEVRKMGKRFFEVTFFPHVNHKEEVDYVVAETKDITEEYLAGEALRKQNEDLKLINQLSTLLLKKASVEELGKLACSSLIETFQLLGANMYLYNSQGNELIPVLFKMAQQISGPVHEVSGFSMDEMTFDSTKNPVLLEVLEEGEIRTMRTRKEIIRLIEGMIPETHKDIARDLNTIVETTGIEQVTVVPLRTIDDRLGILTLVSIHPVHSEDLNRLRTIATMITQMLFIKKEETEQLQQSEKFRLLFENANDAIFLLDDNRFIDCNPRTVDMFGLSRNRILELTPVDVSPPYQEKGIPSSDLAKKYIDLALSGKPQLFEWVHLRSDGTQFYAQVNLNRIEMDGKLYLYAIVRDIDAMKKNYLKIEEQERLLLEAQMLAQIGNWDLNLKTGAHYWSPEVYQILEYPEDIKPSRELLLKRVHPRDRKIVREGIARSIAEGVGFDEVYRLSFPDDRVKYIHGRGKMYRAGNAPAHFRGTIQDITEIKKAEEEIRSRSERMEILNRVHEDLNQGKSLREIVTHLQGMIRKLYPVHHIAVFSTDVISGRFHLLAHSMSASGRKRSMELLGKGVSFIDVPENPDNLVSQMFYHPKRSVISDTNTIVKLFGDFLKIMGIRIPVSGLVKLMRVRSLLIFPLMEKSRLDHVVVMISNNVVSADIDKDLQIFVGQIHSVIRKKMNEMEIQRLYTAVEQMDELFFISNRDGTIFYMNPAIEKLTGISVEEFIGRNTREFRHPAINVRVYEKIWETVLNGKPWTGELKLQAESKVDLDVHAVITPIRDDRGRVVSFITLMRDISKEKEMRQYMERTQKLEMMGRFAGGLAHDFNNVLATMMGYADIALDEIPDKSDAGEYLKKMKASGNKARELIGQLLTFNRSSQPEIVRFSPRQLVDESYDLIKPQIPRNVHIEVSDVDNSVMPEGDIAQMRQVLLNLLSNAIHAVEKTDNGKIRITGYLVNNYRPKGGNKDTNQTQWYRFRVRDNGTGMNKETVDRIFEPFYTTRPVGKGSGMGMSVVYGIVQAHNGSIEVDSKPGHGTSVSVYLPYKK